MPACTRVLRVDNPWRAVLSVLDQGQRVSKVVNHQSWRCCCPRRPHELTVIRPRLCGDSRGSAAPAPDSAVAAAAAGSLVGNQRSLPWRRVPPATTWRLWRLGAWRWHIHAILLLLLLLIREVAPGDEDVYFLRLMCMSLSRIRLPTCLLHCMLLLELQLG